MNDRDAFEAIAKIEIQVRRIADLLERAETRKLAPPKPLPPLPPVTWPKPDMFLVGEDCPRCDGNGGTGFFGDRECWRCEGTGTIWPRGGK